MYIRFVTAHRDHSARAEVGLFGPAYAMRRRHNFRTDPWQVHEINRELNWFGDHLDVPDRFTVQEGRAKGARNGVCWFRDDARTHVGHARYLAFLLDELGEPVVELVADHPGTLIWQDAHQVVALPERDHPVVFH